MYKKYEEFYRKYGLTKPDHFINVRLLDFGEHSLPHYSVIHYYNESNVYPTRGLPLLKNIRKGYVYNIMQYNLEPFKCRFKKPAESTLVGKLNKQYDSLVTIPKYKIDGYKGKRKKSLKDMTIVYNYSLLNDFYSFVETEYSRYYNFVNSFNTLCNTILDIENDVSKVQLHHYVTIDLPDSIYSLETLVKYMNMDKPNKRFMDVFFNNKHIMLLELYKLFYKDYKRNSVFNKISSSFHIDKVVLVFRYKGITSLVNLKVLLSFSKDYSYENKTKYDSKTVTHMLFGFIHKLINSYEEPIVTSEKTELDEESIVKNNVRLLEMLKKTKDVDEPINNELIKSLNISKSSVGSSNSDKLILDTDMDDSLSNVITDEVYVNPYDNVEVIENLTDDNETVHRIIDELTDNKDIDKKKQAKLKTYISEFMNKPSAFDKKIKNKDMLTIDKEDLLITEEESKMEVVPNVVSDVSEARFINKKLNERYINKVLKKDILNTFVNFQKSGLIIKDIEIETHEDILGKYSDYIIQVSDKGKSSYSIKLRISEVHENGTYKLSGTQYMMKKQRNEQIIKKLDATTVALTTATGKVNIVKAPMKKYDLGYKVRRELNKLSNAGTVKNLMFGKFDTKDTKLPKDYTLYSRYIKSFTYAGIYFTFNYVSRGDLLDIDLTKIENTKYILIGKKGNLPILMNYDDEVFVYENNKYNSVGDLFSILNIDRHSIIEYSFVKIFKVLIPTAIVLAYYMGLYNLLRLMKVTYEVIDGNKRVSTDSKTIVLKLKDKTIVIRTETDLQRIVLGGLNHDVKVMKKMTLQNLNSKTLFMILFKELNYNLMTITKIKTLEHLFIDSVSKSILELNKEPTTFIGLTIRASELLIDDYYEEPDTVNTMLLKGYERIPQYIHKVLVDSIERKTSEEFFGKSKLVVDPYAVIKIMNEDSTSELVDDINPIAYLKQMEDTSYLGFQGRKKEVMTAKTRKYNVGDIGVISESVKDNSDVGITAYLSADPMLENVRGMSKQDKKDVSWSNIFSTNTMVTPFALVDDPKRLVYSSIQASHVIAIDNPKCFPVRTPYQTLLAYKMDKKFIGYATDTGVVKSVSNHKVVIDFKNEGRKTYTFNDWTSKEESNTTHKHIMKTNLKEKDKVNIGDIIYYDFGFFEPDMFDMTKVVYRTGTYITAAMSESEDTREDSFTISSKISNTLSNTTIKVKEVQLKFTDVIKDVVSINANLSANSPLFIIGSDIVGDEKIDKATMDLFQGFIKSTPKSGYEGKLIKIQVFYNGDVKDMSKSLKSIVKTSEPYMVDKVTGETFTGKVDSSYSVNAVPLEKDSLHIKFFIETNADMVTGDKSIFGNQLKATVTTITNYPIIDEYGNEIDSKFSYSGIYNRIVPSSDLLGTTGMLLKKTTEEVVKMFF